MMVVVVVEAGCRLAGSGEKGVANVRASIVSHSQPRPRSACECKRALVVRGRAAAHGQGNG